MLLSINIFNYALVRHYVLESDLLLSFFPLGDNGFFHITGWADQAATVRFLVFQHVVNDFYELSRESIHSLPMCFSFLYFTLIVSPDLPPLIDTHSKLEFHAHRPLEPEAYIPVNYAVGTDCSLVSSAL